MQISLALNHPPARRPELEPTTKDASSPQSLPPELGAPASGCSLPLMTQDKKNANGIKAESAHTNTHTQIEFGLSQGQVGGCEAPLGCKDLTLNFQEGRHP